jgi:glycosyltransferase 2 family protein
VRHRASPAMITWLRRRWFEVASLGAGFLILAGTLRVTGIDQLARDLSTIGWGLAVIVLIEGLSVVFNTAGWAFAFPPGERTVGAGRLLALRLAGDGVNYLTPSATVGGELLRIRLLDGFGPSSVTWASVGVAKVGQTASQVVFVCLGLALVLPRFTGLSPWIGGLLGGGVAALAGSGLVWLVGRGFWTTFGGVAGRLALARFLPRSWADPGHQVDLALRRLGGFRVVAVLGCFLAGWAVGAVEIYVILAWVGGSVDWQTALALEIGSVLIDGIFFFVPAKIGTQEGGKVLLFAMLGLDPARGLTVGVVRRIRELAYAGLGLAVLAWLTTRPVAGEPTLRPHGGQNV